MKDDLTEIIVTWRVRVTKANGQLRQFTWWKVPARMVLSYHLSDGHHYNVTLRMSSDDATEPDVLGKFHLRMASGHELYLPTDVRWQIETRAKGQPNAVVDFEMTVFSSLQQIDEEFQRRVQHSLQDSPEERRERLATAEKMPERLRTWAVVFKRNPDVVAETLSAANGSCQRCGAAAPFLRAKDGSPYLEVHHKVTLANGGEDTVENAIALCPNCHRKQHHGQPESLSSMKI